MAAALCTYFDKFPRVAIIINPRAQCAARVTVVDISVCLSVSQSVCLSVRQTLYRLNLGNGKSHGKQTFPKDYKP